MIAASDLRVTPGPKMLVMVCRWCMPIQQLYYLGNVYPLTFGMCQQCAEKFPSATRPARQQEPQ